jgi:hypothetical protein
MGFSFHKQLYTCLETIKTLNMKHILTFLIAAIALTTNAQLKIENVTLPAKMTVSTGELVLNGGGLREKYFLDLYVGGLYLKAKSTNADAIIKADEAMAIKLEIVSKLISSDKMIEAIDEGMKKSTDGKIAELSSEIAAFKSAFNEEIVIGDVFNLVYIPNEGLTIFKNSKKVKTIKGLKFKQAAFGIWLCNDPADEDLKEGMLKG